MKKLTIITFLFFCITIMNARAIDEYIFNLDKPPAYAKEWFELVKKDIKASREGSFYATKKETTERAMRFLKKLPPTGDSSCEAWAAYKYAEQKLGLSRFPNFNFLNHFHKTAKSETEIYEVLSPWWSDGATRHPSMMVTGWALYPPSVSSDSKPEDVRKLRHYVVRLAVQLRRHMADSYDPEYEKHFEHGRSFESDFEEKGRTLSLDANGEPIIPPKTQAQKDTFRIARKEEAWKENMIGIHTDIRNTLRTMDSALCSLFRTHIPGEKPFIKEMLIEAGFKTPEQRKAYWQFCRTLGANWANWTPADEQRLVTD